MKKWKKRTGIELIALAVLVVLMSWYLFMGRRITGADDKVVSGDEETHSLVVYFSREGVVSGGIDAVSSASLNSNPYEAISDAEAAAKMIQQLTGADLFQIRTDRYYRSAFWGTAATAWIEEALDLRPELAAKPENLDRYDVIYIGYPIWWFNAPMAVGTFLEGYDLTGKAVVPFCTSTDNGIDVSMDYIREVSGSAMVLDGYRVHNTGLEDVLAWLERIGMLEQTDEQQDTEVGLTKSETDMADAASKLGELPDVTEGTETYRDFIIDNVYHSADAGDIHYNVYIPESYDGSRPYALYFTLPGYEGLYFQGVAANIKSEEFGFEAQKYNDEMIIVAPQLNERSLKK